MKLVKTIVATAVIVFALTTVAMAGAQRLGHSAEDQADATRAPATHSQPAGAVTLSARQFAALLGAVAHDGDRDRVSTVAHMRSTTRAHARAKTAVHNATHTAQHAQDGTGSGSGSAHHAETRAQTHSGTHAQTHSGTQAQTHSGTHEGETHHDGGCD